MSAFKANSDNPLVALMLGLTFTHMACQKFSAKKHSLVVQVGFALLHTIYFLERGHNFDILNSQLSILCNLNLLFVISRLHA